MSGDSEIILNIDGETLAGWRNDPVTAAVLSFLVQVRDSYRESVVMMPTMSFSIEEIAKELCRVQGIVEGLDQILNLKGEMRNEAE